MCSCKCWRTIILTQCNGPTRLCCYCAQENELMVMREVYCQLLLLTLAAVSIASAAVVKRDVSRTSNVDLQMPDVQPVIVRKLINVVHCVNSVITDDKCRCNHNALYARYHC